MLEPLLTEGLEVSGLATREDLEGRREWYLSLIDLLKTRARRIQDLVDLARPFLMERLEFDERAVKKHWFETPSQVLRWFTDLRSRLDSVSWDADSLEKVIREYAEEQSVGAGKVIHPLRVAVTGREASPGIFEVMTFLGKVRVLERLDIAIARFGL